MIEMAIADEIQNFKEYGKQECNGYRMYRKSETLMRL
jgi:hypothetical protein